MKLLRLAVYVLSVLAPAALLFDPHLVFGSDWENNLWLIGAVGEYIRHHGVPPVELNSVPGVGNPIPVFYGFLFYPALGYLSAALGSALALRAGVLAILAIQFCALLAAGRRCLRHEGVSFVVAASVIWSTYSLTNLYNRGDIAEYFATSFLVASVAFLVAALAEPVHSTRIFLAWMAGVFALLTAGTHPPTGVMAALLFALVGISLAAWMIASGRIWPSKFWVGASACLAAGALILSPWAYATLSMRPALAIAKLWGHSPLYLYRDRCDSLLGRFSPFPYDRLANRQGMANLSTPYVEAPLIFALLVLLAWNIILLFRRPPVPAGTGQTLWTAAARCMMTLAIAWFAFLTAVSVSQPLAKVGLIRRLGPFLQFAYRLVSHCNIALMLAVFASGALVARRGGYARHPRATRTIVAACLSFALAGLAIKLRHANAVSARDDSSTFGFAGDRGQLVGKGDAWLDWQYSTPGATPALSGDVALAATKADFPVDSRGTDFGKVGPLEIDVAREGWAVTNAVIFPWSRILVNGHEWSGANLGRHHDYLLAILLPAGRSRLQWIWSPDPVWAVLYRLSQAAYVLVLGATVVWISVRAVGSLGKSH